MHDIFNPLLNRSQDEFLRRIGEIFLLFISDSFPEYHWMMGSFNLYCYFGVTSPRCFHRDTTMPRVKLFIPLSDVPDMSFGPYAVHLGSHNFNLEKMYFYC